MRQSAGAWSNFRIAGSLVGVNVQRWKEHASGAGERLMKAAVYRKYGPPDVVEIEDVEKPVPKDTHRGAHRIAGTSRQGADSAGAEGLD
jgi:hypothetical protein